MKRVVFRTAAAADVEEAYDWYEQRREGLGSQFLTALEGALESILLFPKAAPIIHRDTRRFLLRRFPYGIHYRLIEADIVVIACFHAKRRPRVWRSR